MNGAPGDEEFLIRYLWHHHVPCPRCRMNLHGLTSPICPRCGERLRIGIGMAQPHLRGWLALATPMIGSAGIGVVLFIIYLMSGMPSQRRYPLMLLSMVYFWSALPLAAILIIGRRAVMRWGAAAQAILAGAAWVLSIAALVLMFLRL